VASHACSAAAPVLPLLWGERRGRTSTSAPSGTGKGPDSNVPDQLPAGTILDSAVQHQAGSRQACPRPQHQHQHVQAPLRVPSCPAAPKVPASRERALPVCVLPCLLQYSLAEPVGIMRADNNCPPWREDLQEVSHSALWYNTVLYSRRCASLSPQLFCPLVYFFFNKYNENELPCKHTVQ